MHRSGATWTRVSPWTGYPSPGPEWLLPGQAAGHRRDTTVAATWDEVRDQLTKSFRRSGR